MSGLGIPNRGKMKGTLLRIARTAANMFSVISIFIVASRSSALAEDAHAEECHERLVLVLVARLTLNEPIAGLIRRTGIKINLSRPCSVRCSLRR